MAFSVSGDTLESVSTSELDASDATAASEGTAEEASEMVAETGSTASDAGDTAATSSGSTSGVEGVGVGFDDHNERLRVLPGKAVIPCRSECGRRRCDDY